MTDDYEDPTVYMGFFPVLMVLYIGLYIYYRKTRAGVSAAGGCAWHAGIVHRGTRKTRRVSHFSKRFAPLLAPKHEIRFLTRKRHRSNIVLHSSTTSTTVQMVLDESSSATSRAHANADKQAKLEERRANIKGALLLRWIVDDDEEEEGRDNEEEGWEAEKEEAAGRDEENCKCERCRDWQREGDAAARERTEEGSRPIVAIAVPSGIGIAVVKQP